MCPISLLQGGLVEQRTGKWLTDDAAATAAGLRRRGCAWGIGLCQQCLRLYLRLGQESLHLVDRERGHASPPSHAGRRPGVDLRGCDLHWEGLPARRVAVATVTTPA